MPLVALRSFTPMGTPCSGPKGSSASTAASARWASVMAASAATVMNAFSSPSYAWMRSRKWAVTSTGDSCFSRMRAAIFQAGASVRSSLAMRYAGRTSRAGENSSIGNSDVPRTMSCARFRPVIRQSVTPLNAWPVAR